MGKSYNEIWNNCLQFIKDNIPAMSYKAWFQPIKPKKLEKNVLTIQVPSHFFYEYLEEHFIHLLREALRKELGANAKLEYSIVMENNPEHETTVKLPGKEQANLKNKSVSMPLNDDKSIRNPFILPGIKRIQINPQLNPEKTFNNFVEGDCNRIAKSAGMTVAANPGRTPFNPLLVYSDIGYGKTHLVQAIGIEVKQRYPDKIVLYVNSNRFQTQYADAVKNNRRNDFMHFYQMIDVLIIDDVQEFANKQGTQEVFFHIFNHLHQSGKQLILACDRPPVELKGLSKRLLSRFKWGLTCDIQAPDYQTKLEILKKKAYNDGIQISDEILEFFAKNVTSNIREMEGLLVSFVFQSTLGHKTINLEFAKQFISKLVKENKKEYSIDYIEKVVCDYFELDVDVIHSKSRKREIVQARQIAMYFSKNLTKASLSSIGQLIGSKDHATVLHACRTVSDLMQTDKNYKSIIEDIDNLLKF